MELQSARDDMYRLDAAGLLSFESARWEHSGRRVHLESKPGVGPAGDLHRFWVSTLGIGSS
jgi:hypothetical protein